jgi:superfamily I DNA and RNA helicase
VLGVGEAMSDLIVEFERARAKDFALSFPYPTEEARKTMTTVNRDMSKAEQERIARRSNSLLEILRSLDSGETLIEDYPEEVVERLQMRLNKKPRRRPK